MIFRQLDLATKEYEEALKLRSDVLRQPLGMNFTKSEFEKESKCYHLVGIDENKVIAVLLLQPLSSTTVKMRQVAVDLHRQRKGVGGRLIVFAENFAREKAYKMLVAHARCSALEFYLRLGYKASGEEFIEATIPHRHITKQL